MSRDRYERKHRPTSPVRREANLPPVIEALLTAEVTDPTTTPPTVHLDATLRLGAAVNNPETPMPTTEQGAATGGGTSRRKRVRASILVTRWMQGAARSGAVDGEHMERVSIPIARIRFVEPYTQDIWISLARSERGPGACRSRITFEADDYMIVTETVEEVDRLMNVPLGGEA